MHRTRSLRLSLMPLHAAAVLAVATASGILAQEPASPEGARLGLEQAMAPSELEAFVDGIVRQAMATDHLAGVTVAVVQDGRRSAHKGVRLCQSRVRTPCQSRYVTLWDRLNFKTFTWIAMMKAVEAGQLGLDDPINSHLPPDQQVPDQGWSEPIRIRHLMTHSAGFEDKVFGHLFEGSPDSLRPSSVYMREQRPESSPRAGAGELVLELRRTCSPARFSKRWNAAPWQEVIEGDILVPLGLVHTSVREPYPARQGLPAPMPETLAPDLFARIPVDRHDPSAAWLRLPHPFRPGGGHVLVRGRHGALHADAAERWFAGWRSHLRTASGQSLPNPDDLSRAGRGQLGCQFSGRRGCQVVLPTSATMAGR